MGDLPNTIPGAHSAAVYRYAVELVEDTRRANDVRLADARDLAAVVRIADESAADRILSAAEEACARDLHIAEQQAEEVVRHARAGIMAAVQRYTDKLIEEARRAGESRLGKATELAELVRLADSNAADRLLQAIQTVNEASLQTAQRQAQGVLETAQLRLTMGGRPADGGETVQIRNPEVGPLGGDGAQRPATPSSYGSSTISQEAGAAPEMAEHSVNGGASTSDARAQGQERGEFQPQEP